MFTRTTSTLAMIAIVFTTTAVFAQSSREQGPSNRHQGSMHQRGPGGPPDGHPPHPLMDALDSNNDGVLSTQEIDAATQALRSLDRNQDGELSFDELAPKHPGRDRSSQRNRRRPERPGQPNS